MADYKVGQTVELTDGRKAVVRYVGTIHVSEGLFIGIELSESSGKNDGSVRGERYFECAPNCGLFIRGTGIAKILQQPAPKAQAAGKAPPPKARPSSVSTKPRPSVVPSSATTRPTSTARKPLSRASSTASSLVSPTESATTGRKPIATSSRLSTIGSTTQPKAVPKSTSVAAPPKTSSTSSTSSSTKAVPPRRLTTFQPKAPSSSTSTAKVNVSNKDHELDELNAKIHVLEKRHNEDRDKVARLDQVQSERDKYENIVQKLNTKLQSMHQENAELKRQAKEDQAKIEKLEKFEQEYESIMELATLDREMAEEKAEAAMSENELMKQRLEEMELEMEILQAENEELGQDMTDEDRNNAGYLQLQRENERLKAALVRLRDVSLDTEADLKSQIKSLEDDQTEFEAVQKENVEMKARLLELEEDVSNLRQQLDAALAAEEIIEELSEQNQMYKDKVTELEVVITDFQNMKEINDELELNHIEHARELREELDVKDSQLVQQARTIAQQDEAITDRDEATSKYREIVYDLQVQVTQAQSSITNNDEQSKEISSRMNELMDLNKQLRTASTSAKSRAIDGELLRLDARQSEEELEIIKIYLPDSIAPADRDSIHAYLRFKRVQSKAQLVKRFIKERIQNRDPGFSYEALLDKCRAFAILEHLAIISADCERIWQTIAACSIEDFTKFESARHDLDPVERTLDHCLHGLRENSFKEADLVPELQRSFQVIHNLMSIHETALEDHEEDEVMFTSRAMEWAFEAIHNQCSLAVETITKYCPNATEEAFRAAIDNVLLECEHGSYWTAKLLSTLEEMASNALYPALDAESMENFSKSRLGLYRRAKVIQTRTEQFVKEVEKVYGGVEAATSSIELELAIEKFSKDSTLEQTAKQVQGFKEDVRAIHEFSATLANCKEIERGVSPWMQRARELEAAKIQIKETGEQLQRYQVEAQSNAYRVKQKDQAIDELNLKIEHLEARILNATQQAGSLQQVQQQLGDLQTVHQELVQVYDRQKEEIKALQIQNHEARKAQPDAQKVLSPAAAGAPSKAVVENSDAMRDLAHLKILLDALENSNHWLRRHEHKGKFEEHLKFLQDRSRRFTPASRPQPSVETVESLSVAPLKARRGGIDLAPVNAPLKWSPMAGEPITPTDLFGEDDWNEDSMIAGSLVGDMSYLEAEDFSMVIPDDIQEKLAEEFSFVSPSKVKSLGSYGIGIRT